MSDLERDNREKLKSKTDIFMASMAEHIDRTIQKETGHRFAFCVVVWKHGSKEQANYVSNHDDRHEVAEAMRSTANRIDKPRL